MQITGFADCIVNEKGVSTATFLGILDELCLDVVVELSQNNCIRHFAECAYRFAFVVYFADVGFFFVHHFGLCFVLYIWKDDVGDGFDSADDIL